MSRILTHGAYHLVRGAEKISVRLGNGEFEVLPKYNCPNCSHEEKPQCANCRSAWMEAVSHIDYSDAFERRVNIFSGWVLVSMGISAAWLNERLGVWEAGEFVSGITQSLNSLLPTLLTLPAILQTALTILLAIIFFITAILYLGLLFASFFILILNPTSKRTWKHFTPKAILATIGLSLTYMIVLIVGVNVSDLTFVVAPFLTGVYAWVVVLCMRKGEDGGVMGEKADGDKLG